jgi:Uri superfamily endonuclease
MVDDGALLDPAQVPADDAGTYVLLVDLPAPATPEVGALGAIDLPAGAYAYVGSALGRGGFGRVGRHADVAAGENGARHWHVDHLLGHPDAALAGVALARDAAVECAWAAALAPDRDPAVDAPDTHVDAGPAVTPDTADASDTAVTPDTADASDGAVAPVEEFGATDCDCPAHLFALPAGAVTPNDATAARTALAERVLAARAAAMDGGR